MSDNRCFRISDSDLDEWRDHAQDPRVQSLLDSFSNWIRSSAPLVDGVVSQIKSAFASTVLGDGIGLFEAQGLDDYATAAELKRLRDADEKLDWTRSSAEDLASCYSSPSFFDAQGFIFHLPAFVIADLNDTHPYGFIERLFRSQEHPMGWRTLLTLEQRTAIIAVLELIRDHPTYEHEVDHVDASIRTLKSHGNLG